MSRLPIPGQDDDVWGNILNDFLSRSLNGDGTLKTSAVSATGAEQTANKGVANGYAGLDGSTKLPLALLPATTLSSASDVNISSPTNNQGLIYNSGTSKWTNQVLPSAPVSSVAGKTGAVTLVEGDITSLTTDLSAKATDSSVVHKAGTETITGAKDFTGGATINSTNIVVTSDSRLTDSRAPNGSASGDLTGIYPSPTLNNTANVESIISANTTVAGAEQTTHKDAANGYAGLDGSGLLKTAELPSSVVRSSPTVNTSQILFGSGDNVNVWADTTTGQVYNAQIGTSGSPDSSLNGVMKVSRTLTLTAAAIVGDGAEQATAIEGVTTATTNNQVQTVGVMGAAINTGNTVVSPDSPDAAGIYGVGRIEGTGIGVGIGGFFEGRTDTASGKASGTQIAVWNASGSAHTINTTGFTQTNGVWLTPGGANKAGVGLQFGNPFGQQFDVGIEFNAQVSNSLTGPIATASIQDDSHALTSLLINGSHSNAAISVVNGAGPVVLGAASSPFPAAKLDVVASPSADPQVAVRSGSLTGFTTLLVQNATSGSRYFVAGGGSQFLTGTANGDTGIQINSTGGTFHFGQSGGSSLLRVSTAGIGAGYSALGSAVPASNQFMLVQAPSDTQTAITAYGHSATQSIAVFQVADNSGGNLFFVGPTGNVGLKDGANIVLGTGGGNKIGTATNQKLGIFNTTPVSQQTALGTSTGFVAGAGTGMTSTSTSTGGSGASAYTFGDLVLALKNFGLLAA